ncbi:response regulator [Pedobacter namyangjuensis]|uniref:response regulator n=1 Tax=Pedobacter namyangjuensis TaxID=600626 RepID=UPI000DE4247E|nr:response regulator [Pedobacter namyangjuensis]
MKPKIFILEDDESIRDLYPYILGEENYDMSTFSCAKDFKENSNEIPQMYILDVMLPDGNGLDIYRELQQNPATADVPVLIMSAHEDPIYVRKQFPRANFLSKPFDITKLIDSVAKNIRLTGA